MKEALALAIALSILFCGVDPGGFEPEEGHELHGDIEYYYRLYVVNTQGGSMAECPQWDIEVFTPGDGFWDEPTIKNMRPLVWRMSLGSVDPAKAESGKYKLTIAGE